MPTSSRNAAPLFRTLLAAAACSALLAGCATKNDPTTTGSIGNSSAVDQAQTLRAAGRHEEAVKVLQTALRKNRSSRPLFFAYGRALADAGRNEEALAALAQAHDPKRPDWRIMNTEAAVLDRMGRTIDAQQRYNAALRLAPDEPSLLSNLGLSLALSNKPAEAEVVLRRAVARPSATAKMRQNLALVLAIQGKYKEAEQLARQDLPPDQVAANLRYWKKSLKTPAVVPPPAKPAAKPAAAPVPEEPLGLRS